MNQYDSQLSRRTMIRLGSAAAGAGAFSALAATPALAEPGVGGSDGAPAGQGPNSVNTSATVVTSYNGWPIGTPGSTIAVEPYLVPGTRFVLPVRSGDVATVLMYLAGRFNREVEPLLAGQNFGYGYRRNVNNPSVWSNHASGTAVDLNADLHANTVKGSFSAAKVAAIRRILTACGGVVYWGGDYTRTVDAMHFEINVAPGDARLPALAASIWGAGRLGPVVTLRARVNGRFVTAIPRGPLPLIADRSAIGPWEQFDLVNRGAGNVALRSRSNGRYVCAEQRGAQPLVANRTAVGPWETFALLRNSDGSRSMRALANGRFVSAEGDGADPLIANRSIIGPWEKFDLVGA